MMRRVLLGTGLVVAFAVLGWIALGRGWLVEPWGPGVPAAERVPTATRDARARVQRNAALDLGVTNPKQILFGDLHVHTTYSTDAFLMALPMMGGEGAQPVSDACDFARFCSALDFWSINDHALALTPRRWHETIDAIRQCNAVAGDPTNPDTVAFLGWELTQMGSNRSNHFGHKNVVLRRLDDAHVPARPIAAAPPPDARGPLAGGPSTFRLGLIALLSGREGGAQFARYMQDLAAVPLCPDGVPERELPLDCKEQAATPEELFAKLDDWGFESLVIPHGTTWGFYTPLGSSWAKQLRPARHDPARQRLVEVYSGHGNSEEYRPWRSVVYDAQGEATCPKPTAGYLPSCWRAGEIIRERCTGAGESAETCEARAREARQNYLDANVAGFRTVPGASVADWQDAGQCRDCFLPAFNFRPQSSVQYMLALGRPTPGGPPLRFRFGMIASSDNHSARPGTGYKEYARNVNTEARFGRFVDSFFGRDSATGAPVPRSVRFDAVSSGLPFFSVRESERQASFFLTGGLVAVHSQGRDRDALWRALERREVYGTSGPRILLYFDLLNPPDTAGAVPMGGGARMHDPPAFRVRAVGSLEQKPGCPADFSSALGPDKIARLCRGECYNPGDHRRRITRIEVVRIRPQRTPDEEISRLIEDPWRVFECPADSEGCSITFRDDEFPEATRDSVYYVRAIEEPSLAVGADPLRCTRDEAGRCVELHPCADGESGDDCKAETEERAWSSPIFVDYVAEP
ncbi:MAG: DUF3604 domain-containing protein [Myxococcota bacterium]